MNNATYLNVECKEITGDVAKIDIAVEVDGTPMHYSCRVSFANRAETGAAAFSAVAVNVQNPEWMYGDEPELDLRDCESEIEDAIAGMICE